jgi:hypothetical protein
LHDVVANPGGGKLPSSSAANRRQSQWAVRPGYSSGASSVALDEDDEEQDEVLPMQNELSLSRHTSILALSELRRENQMGLDLASFVVRIEVRGIPA